MATPYEIRAEDSENSLRYLDTEMKKSLPGPTIQSQFKSLLRVIDILSVLEKKNGLSVTEISNGLGLPRSTTYKYLAVMKECRFVDYDRSLEKYRLGMKLFEFGSAVQNRFAIDRIARPYMEELSNQLEETVVLNVLDGNSTVYLESVEPRNRDGIVLLLKKGLRHPLHTGAAGKILLAYQPEEKIELYLKTQNLVKYTAKTIVDADKLRKHLKAIKKAGYSLSVEEFDLGFGAIAVPLFDHEEKIIAGLFVFGPLRRINGPKKEKILDLLLSFSKKISERIKGNLP